jgi:transcription elongation GreA/GreB family factor
MGPSPDGGARGGRRPCAEPEWPNRTEGAEVSTPTNTVPISARGYAERSRELDELRARARRPRVEDDALELLERRIAVLEGQLALAEVVPPAGDGAVGFGSLVHVCDDDGRTFSYELVGPLEADLGRGRISVGAPVGRALVGRRHGERVDVETPRGVLTLEITAVRNPRTG